MSDILNRDLTPEEEKILRESLETWKEEVYSKLMEEVESKFYPTEGEIIEKKLKDKAKKEKEEILKKYYEKKSIYNLLDIKKYLAEEAFITSEKINEDLIPYPVLIKFFKNNELLAIKKESANIKSKLLNVIKSLDFDEYSIVHIPKGKIDDLLVEAFINNKVRYWCYNKLLDTDVSFSIKY